MNKTGTRRCAIPVHGGHRGFGTTLSDYQRDSELKVVSANERIIEQLSGVRCLEVESDFEMEGQIP